MTQWSWILAALVTVVGHESAKTGLAFLQVFRTNAANTTVIPTELEAAFLANAGSTISRIVDAMRWRVPPVAEMKVHEQLALHNYPYATSAFATKVQYS